MLISSALSNNLEYILNLVEEKCTLTLLGYLSQALSIFQIYQRDAWELVSTSEEEELEQLLMTFKCLILHVYSLPLVIGVSGMTIAEYSLSRAFFRILGSY